MAKRLDGQGGSWRARTVEKICASRRPPAPAHAPGSTWSTPPGRASPTSSTVPRAAPRRRIFQNQIQLSGSVPHAVPALRPVGGPGAPTCPRSATRLHDREKRLHVPRLAAHGRDGDRREGLARGDGRRAHATARSPGCGDLLAPDEPSALAAARAYLASCRRRPRTPPAAPPRPAAPGGARARRHHPRAPAQAFDCSSSSAPSSTRAPSSS